MRYELLIVAIVLIIAGAILTAVYDIPVGTTSVGVILIILGVICLIAWVILLLIGYARTT